MNQKSVFYNSLLTIVRQVLSIVFGFIAMVLIARVLGKEGQGQYTLAILLPSLLYTLMNSGMPASTVFFIGQKKYSDEEIYSTTFFNSNFESIIHFSWISVSLFFQRLLFCKPKFGLTIFNLIDYSPNILTKEFTDLFSGKRRF